jgi:hypothetical protein
MNTVRHTIALCGIVSAGLLAPVPATVAAENAPPPVPQPEAETKPKLISTLQEVAFLGIETVQTDAATRQRLKLDEGTGLRVRLIATHSPANQKLQSGDVLIRLDEQILCNHDQLRALIRAQKPGNTVTLKLYRDGVIQELKIQLASVAIGTGGGYIIPSPDSMRLLPEVRVRIDGQDIPLRDLFNEQIGERIARLRGGVITIDPEAFKDIPDEARAKLREMQKNIQEQFEGIQRYFDDLQDGVGDKLLLEKRWNDLKGSINGITPDLWRHDDGKSSKIEISAPGKSLTISENETLTFTRKKNDGAVTLWMNDRDGTACLTTRDGCRCIRIQNTAGTVIFDGPVDTPEQRAAMPEAAVKKLEFLEQLSGTVVPVKKDTVAKDNKKGESQ